MEELRRQTEWWGKSEFSDGRKLLPFWKLEGQRLRAGGLLNRLDQVWASLMGVGTTQETWPWAENETKKYFFPPPALQPHLRPSRWLHPAGSHRPWKMQPAEVRLPCLPSRAHGSRDNKPSMASLHLGMRILRAIALWFAGRFFTVWASREAFSSLMGIPSSSGFLRMPPPSCWPSSFSSRFGSYPLLTTLQGCPPPHPPTAPPLPTKIKKRSLQRWEKVV